MKSVPHRGALFFYTGIIAHAVTGVVCAKGVVKSGLTEPLCRANQRLVESPVFVCVRIGVVSMLADEDKIRK